jgi:hypothetical protein
MKVSRTCPACGYTADYANGSLADAHNRRHSCDKHGRASNKPVAAPSDFRAG